MLNYAHCTLHTTWSEQQRQVYALHGDSAQHGGLHPDAGVDEFKCLLWYQCVFVVYLSNCITSLPRVVTVLNTRGCTFMQVWSVTLNLVSSIYSISSIPHFGVAEHSGLHLDAGVDE
eukprot:scaffold100749_cov28-Tisochrysis_lutea.AAC.1